MYPNSQVSIGRIKFRINMILLLIMFDEEESNHNNIEEQLPQELNSIDSSNIGQII